MTKFEDVTRALADQRREHFLTCKPSELILLALEDLEKTEKMTDVYRVNMEWYHAPLDNGICNVCLGGAVLAQTVKLTPSMCWGGDADGNVEGRIFALDSFRTGHIGEGLSEMGIQLPFNVRPTVRMRDYERDPVDFKSGLRWIAKHLGERGL